jgi:hypothetical protein
MCECLFCRDARAGVDHEHLIDEVDEFRFERMSGASVDVLA